MKKSAVISVLAVALVVAGSWFWFSSRSSLKRAVTKNNMKQFGLLIHNYHDALGKLPARDDVLKLTSSANQSDEPTLLHELEQDCVILWEAFPENFAALRETGEDMRRVLIAYERGADERGGYALFLDGAAREIRAEEFQSLFSQISKREQKKQAENAAEQQLLDSSLENYDPVKAIESSGGQIDLTSSPKYVYLHSQSISDDDLKHLSGFHELEQLTLNRTEIEGSGLMHLSGMANLTYLGLAGTKVDDGALQHITHLIKLEELSLNSTKVTNDAIEHLAQLKNLKVLKIIDTQLTEDGVKRLQDALPECRIVGP